MTFGYNADASGTSIATRQGFQDRVFLLLPQQDQETIRQHTVPNAIDVDMNHTTSSHCDETEAGRYARKRDGPLHSAYRRLIARNSVPSVDGCQAGRSITKFRALG